mgnify:CR=1 FL=1|tara:strand:+ start:615 stop:947 length:333 start_codon:yes stop_codon:yes gene_type:complete
MELGARVRKIRVKEKKNHNIEKSLFNALNKKERIKRQERYMEWLNMEDYSIELGEGYEDMYVNNLDKILTLNYNINRMLEESGYKIIDKKGFRNELGSIIYRLSSRYDNR